MLDPDIVLGLVVTAFQSNPSLVAALGGSPAAITGHYFAYGQDNALTRSIEQMPSGAILIAYTAMLWGQAQIDPAWKHQFKVFIRPTNQGATPQHLWWLAMHGAITAPVAAPRFSDAALLPSLSLPDNMNMGYREDGEGMDFFECQLTIPERGDD